MATGSTHASTQDNTSGTLVSTATNEDNGSTALQCVVPVGNKSSYSATSRTGLTAVDTATTDLTTAGFASAGLIDCGQVLSLDISCSCDTASKTLTGYVVFYDGSSNPVAISETLSFTSDAANKISSTRFVCPRQIVDCGGNRKCKFYVLTITGTTWDVVVRPI